MPDDGTIPTLEQVALDLKRIDAAVTAQAGAVAAAVDGVGAVSARLDTVAADVVALRADGAAKSGCVGQLSGFFASGVFFMLIGGAMLWAAYGTMGETHTSLTFVLVVVGVAILLYGTGTQSAGEAVTGQLKVYLAGGAGVLAFLVGYGIVYKSAEIKAAFQVEKKYFRYLLTVDNGSTDLSDYVALADIGGDQVPALRHGRFVEVYIPYFDTMLTGKNVVTIRGTVEFFRLREAPGQLDYQKQPLEIVIPADRSFVTDDGGLDFPRYNGDAVRVSLLAPVPVEARRVDQQELNPGAPAPPPVGGRAE